MELQIIINTLLPLVFIALGWFCKELWSAIQTLKNDLNSLKTHLAENYLHKDDFSSRWDEVLKAIHRIEDKLDKLKDK
jgi:hypothetical protein